MRVGGKRPRVVMPGLTGLGEVAGEGEEGTGVGGGGAGGFGGEGVAEDLAGLGDAGVEEWRDGVPGDGEGDEAAEGVGEGVAAADVGELVEEDGGEFVVVGEMPGQEEDGVEDAGYYGSGRWGPLRKRISGTWIWRRSAQD